MYELIKTEIIDVKDIKSKNYEKALLEASSLIKSGELVAFPTETVYGLGADASNQEAVLKIFKAKGRPADNPLIVHASSAEQARELAFFTPMAKKLARRFWPGPLTLVLKSKNTVCSAVQAGLDTIAIRVPQNALALDLIKLSGLVIAAPSANTSTRPSPTNALSVLSDMNGKIKLILDGGDCTIGIESTVIDVTKEHPVLLRPGGIDFAEILDVLKEKPVVGASIARPMLSLSPGTRHRHYAPLIPFVLLFERDGELNIEEILPKIINEEKLAYIGIKKPPFNYHAAFLVKDTTEYAQALFRALRELEISGASCIAAHVPAEGPMLSALKDRLFKAAGI